MQVYHSDTKGVIDSFVIKAENDYHNGVELDYKWRILVFNDDNEAKKFALSLGVKKADINGNFEAITIPCDVFSKHIKFMVHHPNTHGYILFIEKEVDTETIAHECYHAAFCSMSRVVTKVTNDYNQQEMLAYLTGQYVKSFYDEYNNRQSRSGFFRTKPKAQTKRRVSGSGKKLQKRGSK